MARFNQLICFFITAGCLIMAGCMMGPDYVRPETVADTADSFVNAPHGRLETNGTGIVGQWWMRFNDPVLPKLVQAALENNTDLKAAAARMVEAEARWAVKQSKYVASQYRSL